MPESEGTWGGTVTAAPPRRRVALPTSHRSLCRSSSGTWAADNFCVCCALSLGSGFTLRAHSRPVRQEPRSSHFADREAEKQQLGVLEPTLVRVRLPSTPSSWPQSWIAGEEWTTLGSRVEEVRDGGRCQRSIRLHWDGGGAFLVAPLLLGPAS